MNTNDIANFRDFWPLYLRAHESRLSRAFHFGGLVLSLATAVALLSCGMIFFLVLAVVPALLGSFLGHKLSPRHEHVAEEHPEWAAMADLKMFGMAITGRLGRELDRIHEMPARPSRPAWSHG